MTKGTARAEDTVKKSRRAGDAIVVLVAAGVLGMGLAWDHLPRVGELAGGGHTTSDLVGPAAAALEELPVREPAPLVEEYDRDLFGPRWSDDVQVEGGRNGCDTRNDVLRRDLEALTVEPGTQGCVALSGTLTDPYTGAQLPFERGEDTGSQIHIDHLVALSNAWQTGAQDLDEQTRTDLANDPLNLWAVDGAQNMAKSDDDAAEWLPTEVSAQCDLVAAQIAVKTAYDLWVTQPEAEAMRDVLDRCPDQQLPTRAEARPPRTTP